MDLNRALVTLAYTTEKLMATEALGIQNANIANSNKALADGFENQLKENLERLTEVLAQNDKLSKDLEAAQRDLALALENQGQLSGQLHRTVMLCDLYKRKLMTFMSEPQVLQVEQGFLKTQVTAAHQDELSPTTPHVSV